MPIVPALCPSCGGQLQIDNAKDAGICQYCGTAFITEKAIHNYHIKYEIKADTVIVNNKASIEDLLEREEVYQKLNDRERLAPVYEEMIQNYPKRYEGWWGLIRFHSYRFTNLGANLPQLENWFKFVKEAAPGDVLPRLEQEFNTYRLAIMRQKQKLMQETLNTDDKQFEEHIRQLSAERTRAGVGIPKCLLITLILLVLPAVLALGWYAYLTHIDLAAADDTQTTIAICMFLFGPILGIVSLVMLFKFQRFGELFANIGTLNYCRREIASATRLHTERHDKSVEDLRSFQQQIDQFIQDNHLA